MSNEFGHVQTESLIYNTIKKTLHVSHILVPFNLTQFNTTLLIQYCAVSGALGHHATVRKKESNDDFDNVCVYMHLCCFCFALVDLGHAALSFYLTASVA